MPRAALIALAILILLPAAACRRQSEHFRRAQELIAQIESGSTTRGPDYTDYRYDDVMVQLAQVEPADSEYWKAREWIQKIQKARDDVAANAKGGKKKPAPAGGMSLPSGTDPAPVLEPPPPPPDLLEPNGHRGPADIAVMGLSMVQKPYGLHVNGDVINRSGRTLMARVTVTALGADGAELLSVPGIVPPPFSDNDRSLFTISIGAFDPAAPPLDLPGSADDPLNLEALNQSAFDPALVAKFRLAFETTDSEPLTWVDGRWGRDVVEDEAEGGSS